MFCQKIKTYSIDDTEIISLKNTVLDYLANPPDFLIQDDTRRAKSYFKNTHFQEIQSIYVAKNISMAKFISFNIGHIPGVNTKFTFLKEVFGEKFNPWQLSVISIFGGDMVPPHTDSEIRKWCINFPIANFDSSYTSSYRKLKEVQHDHPCFFPDELEFIEKIQYEPKTAYMCNTHVPHSIELLEPNMPEARIVLSYALSDKKQIEDINNFIENNW